MTLRLFWQNVKKFWGLITLAVGFVCGIIVMVVLGKNNTVIDNSREKYDELEKKHLEEIEKIRDEERKKNEEIIAKYTKTIADIQRQFEEKSKKLEEEKKAEIEEIIKQYGNDPVKVMQELSDAFPEISIKMPEDF